MGWFVSDSIVVNGVIPWEEINRKIGVRFSK